jgi:hypothetical protein
MLARTDLLDTLLDALAERLASKVAERLGTPTPRYADATNNPLGSGRAFLDAARRGAFPTFKRRRAAVARWADVEGWIESRTREPRERHPSDQVEEDRALLQAAGVRLRDRRPDPRRPRRRA